MHQQHNQEDQVYDANAGIVPIQPAFDISEANVVQQNAQKTTAKQGQ